ncbi:MAG: DNA alkylation repair protein [Acidimicrobiia bacterium]|nr:DNA alkylation repair protein [Acidimicrobiia bacterium]
MNVAGLVNEIDRRIRALPKPTTQPIRAVRREFSKRLREESPEEVLALGEALLGSHRWVGYELIANHPTAMRLLDVAAVERLGRDIDSWWSVDAFARIISGPAWREGLLQDSVIQRWAESEDRWWRRAALVSTVALNDLSRGAAGDTRRTLDICARLAEDRDDMVIKAMSWALRELVPCEPEATRRFVAEFEDVLAARVKREVRNKLNTGLKNPKR